MFNIGYVEVLLTVLTVCAVVVTAVLVAGITQARRTLAALDLTLERVTPLLPELERLSRETEETLRSVRELSRTAGDIARDVGRVTSETRRAALPLIDELGTQAKAVRMLLRHLTALAAGTRAGLAVLARGKSS